MEPPRAFSLFGACHPIMFSCFKHDPTGRLYDYDLYIYIGGHILRTSFGKKKIKVELGRMF